jgi:hypothetical protein
MPIFAVPKVEPGDFWLVTHQSFGKYSLNSLTPPHERSFPLDNLVWLGDQLLRAHHAKDPNDHLVLWKSDVAEAYHLLPMHPYWQIKQVNTINGVRYIDQNCAFSG